MSTLDGNGHVIRTVVIFKVYHNRISIRRSWAHTGLLLRLITPPDAHETCQTDFEAVQILTKECRLSQLSWGKKKTFIWKDGCKIKSQWDRQGRYFNRAPVREKQKQQRHCAGFQKHSTANTFILYRDTVTKDKIHSIKEFFNDATQYVQSFHEYNCGCYTR